MIEKYLGVILSVGVGCASGPHRFVRWLGSLVNTFDSSDGCVGLATDDEINAVAAWVTKVSSRSIELR